MTRKSDNKRLRPAAPAAGQIRAPSYEAPIRGARRPIVPADSEYENGSREGGFNNRSRGAIRGGRQSRFDREGDLARDAASYGQDRAGSDAADQILGLFAGPVRLAGDALQSLTPREEDVRADFTERYGQEMPRRLPVSRRPLDQTYDQAVDEEITRQDGLDVMTRIGRTDRPLLSQRERLLPEPQQRSLLAERERESQQRQYQRVFANTGSHREAQAFIDRPAAEAAERAEKARREADIRARPAWQQPAFRIAGIARIPVDLWTGMGRASHDAYANAYSDAYGAIRARELDLDPRSQAEFANRAESSAGDLAGDQALSATQFIPAVGIPVAAPARAATRAIVGRVTGRTPLFLRPHLRQPRLSEPPGPLTTGGRQFARDVLTLGATKAIRERPVATTAVAAGATAAATLANADDDESPAAYDIEGNPVALEEAPAAYDVDGNPAELYQDAPFSLPSMGRSLALASPLAILPSTRLATRLSRVATTALSAESAAAVADGTPYEDAARVAGSAGGALTVELALLLRLRALQRSGAQLSAAEQARIAELESRFGRYTEGQRTGSIDQLQVEDNIRMGRQGDRAANTILDHDAEAAREIQANSRNIVTRGNEALSSDLGDAGRQYVERMRDARESLRETAQSQYEIAMGLARNERLPQGLNNLPSQSLEEAAYRGDFALPGPARQALERLEEKIARGDATHATIESTRQELNRLLREAAFRRGADERHLSQMIDALDEWQQGVLDNPAAQRAMAEARGIWREQARLFEPQGRTVSETGHTLRTDVAGRAMDRLINEETTGRQGIRTALGEGFASSSGAPGNQALGMARRTRAIGTRTLSYTNREAPSGVRVPGRISLGDQDWAALDMNTRRSQQFVADRAVYRRLGELMADGLDAPAINARMAQEGLGEGGGFGHIIERIRSGEWTRAPMPSPELQTLREGAFYKIMEPLDDYLRAVEQNRIQGAGYLPAQRLVSQLDNALNKGGAEIMQALYTKSELTEMRDLVEYMGRLIPPKGVSRSGSDVWMKHLGAALMGFVRNYVPLLGPVIGGAADVLGAGLSEGAAIRQAQRAVRTDLPPPRPPTQPRPRLAGAIAAGTAAGGTLGDENATGIDDYIAPTVGALTAVAAPRFMRGIAQRPGAIRISPNAALAVGAGAGAGGVMAASDAEAANGGGTSGERGWLRPAATALAGAGAAYGLYRGARFLGARAQRRVDALEDSIGRMESRELRATAEKWDIDPHQPTHDIRAELFARVMQDNAGAVRGALRRMNPKAQTWGLWDAPAPASQSGPARQTSQAEYSATVRQSVDDLGPDEFEEIADHWKIDPDAPDARELVAREHMRYYPNAASIDDVNTASARAQEAIGGLDPINRHAVTRALGAPAPDAAGETFVAPMRSGQRLNGVGPIIAGAGLGAGAGYAAGELLIGDAQAQEGNQDSTRLAALEQEVQEFDGLTRRVREARNDEQRQVAVIDLQEFLKSKGVYGEGFRPDGVWGGGTDRGVEQFTRTRAAALGPIRERLAASQQDEALRRAERPPGWTLAREGIMAAGGIAGLAYGLRGRGKTVLADEARQIEANRAINRLVSSNPVDGGHSASAQRGRLRRVSRLNEFWERGGAGNRVPFQTATTPEGFSTRPRADVADMSELYPAPRRPNRLRSGDSPDTGMRQQDWSYAGYGAAEAGGFTVLLMGLDDQIARAERAYAEDNTPANRRELENLRDVKAGFEALARAGIGYAAGRFIGASRTPYRHVRPNVGVADQSRFALQDYLNASKAARKVRPPSPPPATAPRKTRRKKPPQ